jgi:predicted nucleic acid-binding protein
MCVILDVNNIGKFNEPADEDMKPVWDWLDRQNGKIAYASTKKFEEEWERGGGIQLRRELQRRNKLKEIPAQDVQEKADELEGKIESDDPHIIALAIIANVKVLVSNDRTLHEDFKNRDLVGGSVYQTKSHSRLLRKDTCP